MAEQKYTRGLLGWLTGFDPNNPTAPRKPALSPASTNGRGGANRPPAKTGDGNIYKNGAGTQQSAQRTGMPANKPPANAAVNTAVPNKRGPVSGATRGALGLPAQSARGEPTTRPTGLPKRAAPAAPSNPPSRPTAGRPPDLPFSRKSPEAAAKQVVTNAAAFDTPKAKPTPAPKQSWWDKFSDDHKLSAAKSYADYKKLMESM